jgi:hypothetical protein
LNSREIQPSLPSHGAASRLHPQCHLTLPNSIFSRYPSSGVLEIRKVRVCTPTRSIFAPRDQRDGSCSGEQRFCLLYLRPRYADWIRVPRNYISDSNTDESDSRRKRCHSFAGTRSDIVDAKGPDPPSPLLQPLYLRSRNRVSRTPAWQDDRRHASATQ